MTTTELSSEAKIAQFDAMVAVVRHRKAVAALRDAKEKCERAYRASENQLDEFQVNRTHLEREIENARVKAREYLCGRAENRLIYTKEALVISAEICVSAGFPDDMRAKLSEDVAAFHVALGNYEKATTDKVENESEFAAFNGEIEVRRAELEKSSAAWAKAKAEYDAANDAAVAARDEEYWAREDMLARKILAQSYLTGGDGK